MNPRTVAAWRARPAATLLMAALLVAAVAQPVLAFPRPQYSSFCPGSTIKYRFEGSNWSDAQKERVRLGFEAWNAIRNANGAPLVSISEVSSGHNVRVYKTQSLGHLGIAQCFLLGTDKIELDAGLSLDEFRYVGSHEMGHILNMRHTGDASSDGKYNGPTNPVMGACTSWGNVPLRLDDYGNATHKRSTYYPNSIFGNDSFEQWFVHWNKSGPLNWVGTTAQKSHGNNSLLLTPTGLGGRIHQTANFATSGARKIDAVAHVKKSQPKPQHSGIFIIDVAYKRVTYSATGDCGTNTWPSEKNQNIRQWEEPVWMWFLWADCDPPSNNWFTCQTQIGTMPVADAHDIRLELGSVVQNQLGQFVQVGVDFVRVRDRS